MDKNNIIKYIQKLINDIDGLHQDTKDTDELDNIVRQAKMIIRNAPFEESSRSEYLVDLKKIRDAFFPVMSLFVEGKTYDKLWPSGEKQMSSLFNTMIKELGLFEEKQ